MKNQSELKESFASGLIRKLRDVCNRFGTGTVSEKTKLLRDIAASRINAVKDLIEYHDCLLFMLAHPENRELFDLSGNELSRIAGIVKLLYNGRNVRTRLQLTGTGLAWTQVNVAFSFSMLQWLVMNFGNEIKIFESAADAETVKNVYSLFLQKSELRWFDKKDLSLENFIHAAKGNSTGSDLQYLLKLVEGKRMDPEIRDLLYDSLKIYVSWQTNDKMPSRTFGRSLPRRIFFHKKELSKHPDAKKIIAVPIKKAVQTTPWEKKQLVDTSRGILCMMLRETDPVTYADENQTQFFDMGRGVDIALYPMVSERRLPFESYIGYTAFKNRLPVAYGGGWIFQQRSKIGINVFEPFRGGESAYLFYQVLRLYHHHFGVNRFIVEPYQIGKGNMEGLRSGAFWFYYRLGFRPLNEHLVFLAETEYQKIKGGKGYRSPLKLMKKLAESDMELILSDEGFHQRDPAFLSEVITSLINERFSGERKKAGESAVNEIKKFLRINNKPSWMPDDFQALSNFSLLMLAFNDLLEWKAQDRIRMVRLIRLKGRGSEFQYIHEFRQHLKLNWSIARL